MAEISKQALKVENNTEFPNNNNGQITPSRLRTFNEDMIDSLVDEISYNADSASWEQSIAALEAFTGSATGLTTGSLLITASANLNTITFTKGDGSTFNINVNTGSDATDLGPLNAFTASVAGTNAFTQSANLRLASLEATTASLNTSISNLNVFTQSIQAEVNGLEARTGSYATTGSNTFIGNQTIEGSVSASSFISASRFVGNGSQLTGITASVATTILDDGILQGTATALNFTGSGITATVIAGIATIEAQVDQTTLNKYTLTSSFNDFTTSADSRLDSIEAFTASADQRLDSIEAQSGSWVTSAITASSLVTASYAAQTITFTKGDGTTFGVFIPDASGSVLPAGTISGSQQIADLGFISSSVTSSMAVSSSLYAETASLAINAKDIIVNVKNTTGGQLNKGTVVRIIGATGDNPLIATASWEDDSTSANTLGFVVNNIPNDGFGTVMTQGTLLSVNTDGYAAGQLLYLSSSGQYTNVKPPAPYHEVRLGQVLRAQLNNGSIYVLIQNGYELEELHNVNINTGSLADRDILAYNAATAQWENQTANELGLATTGSNTFYGDEIVSGNVDVRDNIYAAFIDMKNAPNGNGGSIFFRASGSNVIPGSKEFWSLNPIFQDGDFAIVAQPSNEKAISFGLQDGYVKFWQGLRLESGFDGWDIGNTPLIISSSFGGQTEMLDVKGNVSASNLNLSGALTASILEGYALVGGAGNISTLVPTSSFSGGGGGQTFEKPSLISVSGSLGIVANTFTSGAANFAHISASADNQANIVFKNNNNTVTTIVSGSGNIFNNPANVTAGFVRFVGTNNNIHINVLPQLTGSAAFPITMSNNISNSGMLLRVPVSSSAYTFNGNVFANGTATAINLGISAANNFERAVSGFTLNNNVIAGAINAVAAKTPLSSSINITNNMIGGTVALNMDSSSISLSGNTVQGGLTVNNSYFPSTYNAASANIGVNGGLYVGAHTIYVSGSNATFTSGRSIASLGVIGANNVISASFNGDNSNVNSTIILGQSLTVFGSNTRQTASTMPDYGSVFVGRWNDLIGTKANTAETIFAVGTGTGSVNRKTGFLIDSGSNTFIEGTLNVSGSTTITGSVTISGSAQSDLTVVGQIFVSSSAATSTTAPRITVSGSAGRTVINRNGITITDATDEGGMFPSTLYAKDSATFDEIGFTVDASVFGITGWSTGPSIYVNNTVGDTYPAVIGFQNKANYTDGRVAVLTPLSASAGFTASLQNGYTWVGNSLGQNSQVPTSSFVSTINTGSFATTGSNNFVGTENINGELNVTGSSSFTGSMNFLSGSASGSVVTNIGDTFTGTAAVTKIISLSSAEYTALSPKDPNTLYIIV